MNRTKKWVAAVAAAVAVSGLTGGALATQASAAGPSKAPTAVSEPTSPDTDNLQQGDQTTPDTASGRTVTASHAPTRAATGSTTKAKSSGAVESSGEAEQANEAGEANDGPGGHQDPAGDVQHEGGANEQ